MTPSGQYKACPRCHQPAELVAPQCAYCGHVYRTQFAPPDQTQMFCAPTPRPGMSGWRDRRLLVALAAVGIAALGLVVVGILYGYARNQWREQSARRILLRYIDNRDRGDWVQHCQQPESRVGPGSYGTQETPKLLMPADRVPVPAGWIPANRRFRFEGTTVIETYVPDRRVSAELDYQFSWPMSLTTDAGSRREKRLVSHQQFTPEVEELAKLWQAARTEAGFREPAEYRQRAVIEDERGVVLFDWTPQQGAKRYLGESP